jgi:phosphoglycerol transferase MdoB-like AlkP superfamily enzyme
VPGDITGIEGSDPTSRFLNSIWYTDQVVYDFVNYCKTQPWWNETVMIIVGDHGHILPRTKRRSDDFHIPMLWLGGAVEKRGVISYPVSQLDIASTLSSQLGIKTIPAFSKDLFSSSQRPWAFFTYNDAFGFINDSSTLVLDNIGHTVVQRSGPSLLADRAGKALQQMIFSDYLSK